MLYTQAGVHNTPVGSRLVVIHKVVNRSLGQGSSKVVSAVVGVAPRLVAYLTDLGVCEDSQKFFWSYQTCLGTLQLWRECHWLSV